MNVYKVTTPTISACVLSEDANAAIDCFVDGLLAERINTDEFDINYIEQIASENQPRCFKSDYPSRLFIDMVWITNWLESKGYKVTRKDEDE